MGRRSGFDIWSALGAVSDEDSAAGNQADAKPIGERQTLPQKEYGKDCDKDDTELVDRRNACGITEFSTPGNSRSTTRRLPGPIEQGNSSYGRTPYPAIASFR